MRRGHYIPGTTPPVEDGLIFFAPLTSNSIDVVGGKTSIGEAISYDSNGAYFSNSSTNNNNLKYLCYEISEQELKSIKTICCEFLCSSSYYDTQTVYCLGTAIRTPYASYNNVNGEGANRNYKGVWHYIDFFDYKYSSKTPPTSGWSIDADDVTNTQISQNTWYKIAGCTYASKQMSYCNGSKNYQKNYTDTFNAFNINASPQTGHCYLTIGGRLFGSPKQLTGYVRNVKMYTKEFTDAELAAMTTLNAI